VKRGEGGGDLKSVRGETKESKKTAPQTAQAETDIEKPKFGVSRGRHGSKA